VSLGGERGLHLAALPRVRVAHGDSWHGGFSLALRITAGGTVIARPHSWRHPATTDPSSRARYRIAPPPARCSRSNARPDAMAPSSAAIVSTARVGGSVGRPFGAARRRAASSLASLGSVSGWLS